MPNEPMPDEVRPFVPPIGSVWVWEPMKAHAVAVVTVLDARWNGEEVWLTIEDRKTKDQTVVPLDRWVEATVLVSTVDDPEHGHDFIRTVPTDGRWCRLCGVAEAKWAGDPCPMHGGAERIERLLIDSDEPPGVVTGGGDEVMALRSEVEELRREVAADDEILAHRQRLMDAVDAIEECRAHGAGCVPHGVQWVERTAAEVERLRAAVGNDGMVPVLDLGKANELGRALIAVTEMGRELNGTIREALTAVLASIPDPDQP